jgi:hypothetical protein
MNDDADMRRFATPLADMLERTRATALVLRHFNKKEGLRSMYRGGGSVAIIAAARAAFALAPHPDEPGVKVFAPVKHNLGPRPHSLTFTIEPHSGVSRIEWTGQTELTAADVLRSPKQGASGGKLELAKGIIAEILERGPRGENEVRAALKEAEISDRTYWRARKDLRVQSEKTGFQGQAMLSLPSTNGHTEDIEF